MNKYLILLISLTAVHKASSMSVEKLRAARDLLQKDNPECVRLLEYYNKFCGHEYSSQGNEMMWSSKILYSNGKISSEELETHKKCAEILDNIRHLNRHIKLTAADLKNAERRFASTKEN